MLNFKPYDFARKKVVYCWLDESISEVSKRLVRENIGSLIVDDKTGKHVGMLTDSLIFEAISSGREMCNLLVKELSLEPLITASVDADMDEITDKLKQSTSGRIALIDDEGSIVGVLKQKNLERFARLQNRQTNE